MSLIGKNSKILCTKKNRTPFELPGCIPIYHLNNWIQDFGIHTNDREFLQLFDAQMIICRFEEIIGDDIPKSFPRKTFLCLIENMMLFLSPQIPCML